MKLSKKKIAVLMSFILSTASAQAATEPDDTHWFDWFFALFETSTATDNVNASGINKPPPR
ncbi:hypothetical protein EYS14_24265 [Alteromonadaceae bacterium M269]|nr:hypothetical protein EYS14_24265 [Alteromonadaceae bacterium M269]